MKLDGERRIPLPRAQVWRALNDPDVLRASIPGCKTLEKTSDTSFTARVTAKIGLVSAALAGVVELSDIVPEEAYTISGSGQGGVAGFAKGCARITLADDGAAATLLTYKATAEVGGKLAGVGGRLLEGAARKTADQCFDGFVSHLAGDGSVADAPVDDAQAGVAAPASPFRAPAAPPGPLRIEVGDIRITHQLSPAALLAAACFMLAVVALLWRGMH